MEASQSVPELVAAAQTDVKPYEDHIAANLTAVADGETRAAIAALEAASVDIFSLFEARMQHHFKRGPFSRKLKALLLEAGEGDLADRIHQYYLAINVLKHGKGASHRELLKTPSALFVVRASDEDQGASLVDISAPGFFAGLTQTILDAHSFLEARV